MLVFLITKKHRYTLGDYLKWWAPEFVSEVRILAYEDLALTGYLAPGTYIFCDQERWTQRQRDLAIELWDQLANAGPSFVLLNDPRQVLLRYELLRRLHDIGQNAFNAYRLSDAFKSALRFPVFLHSTAGHEGAASPLLPNRILLGLWMARRAHRWNTTIVEEFCDVASSGLFSKFGAFNLGGPIVPRHLFFGKNWCLQDTEMLDEEKVNSYRDYLRDNPHEQQVGEVFRLAHIDYGRIDYAFSQGRIQVWEINTNPMIISAPHTFLESEFPLGEMFNAQIKPHLRRLSALHQQGLRIPYQLSGAF